MNIYKWHRFFAWHPVKLLSGEWCWLKSIYRRCYEDRKDCHRYHYTDNVFDILR